MSNGKQMQQSRRSESFTGPHWVGTQEPSWTSANLQLYADFNFTLELWQFYESWSYLPQDKGGGPSGLNQSFGSNQDLPKAPKNLDEVRASFAGTYHITKAPSVKLSGFKRKELNQEFVEDVTWQVGGQPTWWSLDGQCFLYFAEEHGHWKANATRLAGGDGFDRVQVGNRRAGCGYAHSSAVEESNEDPAVPLGSHIGWFETVDDDWEPAIIEVRTGHASSYHFHSDEVVIEERHERGSDGLDEEHVAESVDFLGWRKGEIGEQIRLVLPTFPDRITPESLTTTLASIAPSLIDQPGENQFRDPDDLILLPSAKL